MCMEDIRIGRAADGSELNVPVTTSFGPFLSPDPLRVSFTVYPVSADTVHFSSKPAPGANDGVRVLDATGPVTINLYDHGKIVTAAWVAKMAVGAQTVTVIESHLQKE